MVVDVWGGVVWCGVNDHSRSDESCGAEYKIKLKNGFEKINFCDMCGHGNEIKMLNLRTST